MSLKPSQAIQRDCVRTSSEPSGRGGYAGRVNERRTTAVLRFAFAARLALVTFQALHEIFALAGSASSRS